MSETAAATRKADDSSTPFKGELKYMLENVMPAFTGPINTYMEHRGVLKIYDGERWVPLESNVGIAVVNDMMRTLATAAALVLRQQDQAADRSRSEPQPPSARSLPPD